MKKIYVQGKMTKTQAMFISCLLISIFILGLIYLVISADWAAGRAGFSHTRAVFSGFIGIIPFVVYGLYEEIKKNEEFVSELRLTNDELSIVYRNCEKITKITKINLDNIKGVQATLTADRYSKDMMHPLYCQTDVIVKTKDNQLISFTESGKHNYSFMIRLLAVAKELPDFTFDVKGNSKTAKKDIKHFLKYGKRLHWLKIFLMEFKNCSASAKIRLIFAGSILALVLIFMLFFLFLL